MTDDIPEPVGCAIVPGFDTNKNFLVLEHEGVSITDLWKNMEIRKEGEKFEPKHIHLVIVHIHDQTAFFLTLDEYNVYNNLKDFFGDNTSFNVALIAKVANLLHGELASHIETVLMTENAVIPVVLIDGSLSCRYS